MARARFPGKPLRATQRRRVRVLSLQAHPHPRARPPSPKPKPEPPEPRGAHSEEPHSQKRDENDVDVNANVEVADDGGPVVDSSAKNKSGSETSKVAKTRSQQKMQVVRNDSEKIVAVAAPVKKTVTFGSVESCGDTFKYSKRVPPKCHRPLVSIIKKKSAFKTTENTFHNIVKPAKLTDLGTKTCLDFSTLRAHHNRSPPVKKSALKFSLPEDERNPSRSNSAAQIEDGGRKFVLPSHSAHSSRAIKPNKRFIDPDEAPVPPNSSQATKVLKKPKLILNNQSDGNACYDEAYETCDSSANSNDSSDSKGVENGSNHQSQAKPASYFDKSMNLFGSNPNKSLSTSFQDTFVNGLKNSIKVGALDESESIKSESADVTDQTSNEQLNGNISRRLLQPSRHVSETPCTSDQSSSSTASESSESDEVSGTSDSEESDLDDKGSVEKIPTQSQLVSGKVVLREARLQLNVNNNGVSNNNGNDGPFSTFGSPCATTTNPGTVTCGVCGAVRFYRFVKQARKFGIYSCESCRKFISKMLKRLTVTQTSSITPLQCLSGEGNCRVPPIVRSQQWKLLRCAYNARCPACWLKMCIKAFQVSAVVKTSLQAMLPPFMRPGSPKATNATPPTASSVNNPLLNGTTTFNSLMNTNEEQENPAANKNVKSGIAKKTSEDKQEVIAKLEVEKTKPKEKVETDTSTNVSRKRRHTRIKVRKKDKVDAKQQFDSTKRQKVELKGPRVKHVCRSASIVLGQAIATFPLNDEKNLSEDSDSRLVCDNDKTLMDIKDDSSSDLSKFVNCDCGDGLHTCKMENDAEYDSNITIEEMNIVKEEDSNDSYDSAVLQDTNKENQPDPVKIQENDIEKDETVTKSYVELSTDSISQKKQTKQFLGNFSNIRVSSKLKYNQQRQSELICTDFWESYDPDEVCNTGWGLIGSTPFTVNGVCFLCGSRGQEKLVHCTECCEMYHPFCVEMSGETGRMWLCPRCVQCAGCGQNGNSPASSICRACHRHFHNECLISNRTPKYRNDLPQICSSCLKCKSCDSFKVTKFLGNLPFCSSCFKLRQKGNYCPLCQGCYQDNDFDSKMMECGWCSRWVHASCEGLSGEGYQLVSALPHSVEYICKQCMPENAPWRNMLGTYLRGKLLNILKCLAKNKNACAILKLTPHKKTPIVKKPCICSSPFAVRKLFFERQSSIISSEKKTPVEDVQTKMEPEKIYENNSNFEILPSNNSEAGKAKGVVHKLQESLLQNQEICISVDSCSANIDKIDKLKEKYRIKECCVKMRNFSQADDLLNYYDSDDSSSTISSVDYSETINKYDSKCKSTKRNPESVCKCSDKNLTEKCGSYQCSIDNPDLSPSLIDIKSKVNCNEYSSVKDFNKDMLEAISRTSSPEVRKIYKDVFTESFPWFDCELNCLNPSLEIKDENDDESLKDEELSTYLMNRNYEKGSQKMNIVEDQAVPSAEEDYKSLTDCSYEDTSMFDNRMCVLCKIVGEGKPSMEERLLYCGQGDWIHANCALWSAEVFEEIDGSLQNVQSAIARGKMIKCSKCLNKGASVGCCAKNCSETYHFTCARNTGCALLDDKRVFCPSHLDDAKDRAIQKDNDFVLSRPVYVELDKKKKKFSDPLKVQFVLGSLTVNNVGKIIPSVSDFEDVLIPADFSCARLYWSCKQPWKIVKYTIRTKLLITEPTPAFDLGVNITLDHSMKPNSVERILAEINSWHKSLETDGHNLMSLKKDKSPIKFGKNMNVTLEDYAVKQVMEYMLDIICKQDTNEDSPEEEPQNTADLLPPELKDAIFEDLNHDLLDGISMQDIFPKLMSYEDLIAMDMKNEIGSVSDIVKEVKASENSEDLQEKLKKGLYLSNSNAEQSAEGKNSQDILDELINSQNENFKELKRTKSELMLHGANLKNFAANRNQRSCSLTLSCKLDNATIKRCKLPKSGLIARPDASGNMVMIVDGTSDLIESINTRSKIEEVPSEGKSQWQVKNVKEKRDDLTSRLFNKTERASEPTITELCSDKDKSNSSEQVIDFYTRIHCSPISQLDGADDMSDSNSNCDSPSYSVEYKSIPQLDGADEASSSSCSESGSPPREQNTGIFFRPNDINNTYTMTISATGLNVTPVNEMLIRSTLEDNVLRPGNMEQTVKCDRCHCTYRTKDSFNRHLPTCDMMSTSESEGETPKSPESITLTTLQNAFNAPFNAQTYINQQNQMFESSEQFNMTKPAIVGARRTSVNTRQITINGTIVETQSPEPPNSMKNMGHDSFSNSQDMSNSFTIKSSFLQESPKITLGQGLLSQPQIMVTNLPVTPPRNQTPNGSKCAISHQNQGTLPYSICVKPNTGLHTLPTNSTITHMIPSGNIQTVFSSNPNQMLTLSNPQQNILQNIQTKAPIMQTFTGVPNNQTLTVPVNSIHGLSSAGNNNTFVRPSLPIQNTPTILMPTTSIPRMTSPNLQQKNQVLLPQVNPKSPKKLQQVQPKPIFQAQRGRGRTLNKTPSNKRQNKLEKSMINPPSIGPNGAVIQFQSNGSNQPSIILQQVANPNVMSYVETLQQPHGSYIATITPQGEFKATPTHYISQGGILPQTFQIQQTESGGLVAVPSGGIPVFLPQGGVGILPQNSLQSQGMTISSQGNLQTTPILSQGTIQTQNGTTLLPQTALQTQNGTTLIPQGTAIQGLTQGNIQSQGTLLPANSIQSQGATIVPHNGMNNTSQTILPQSVLQTQGNTLLSQQPGTTIIPPGTILPQGLQFCNDQVLLGSTPTLEMVTDSSGCMYLTTPQPVYYGLETIVQNTVMSSQQFVSTAMQGVLAQNSSFSATTTQVFQASKIEPIVEVPTGYVVVNNVGQDNIIVSQPNAANTQTLISTQPLSNSNISVQSTSAQIQKSSKNISGPNITIQPAIDKQNLSSIHRQGTKTISIQPNQPIFSITPSQSGNSLALQTLPRNIAISQGKPGISLQPLQTNIIQSGTIPISMNNSQTVNTENITMHVNQPNSGLSANSKVITNFSQLNSPTNVQVNSNTHCIEPNLIHVHQPNNTQQLVRSSMSQQCWKPSQNYIQTSADLNSKNPILSIESNDNQINILKTSMNNINNSMMNSSNIVNSSRNFTSTFGQPIFTETSKGNQLNTSCVNSGSTINICHSSQNSSSNNFAIPSSSVNSFLMSTSMSQPIQSNISNMQLSNSAMNKDMCESNTSHLSSQQSMNMDDASSKQSNIQMSCNIHRNLPTSLAESSTTTVNNGNIIQLPNNMMNLSLQGGKIYQIPISNNSVPHMVLNSNLNTNNVQNQINCNLQINSSSSNSSQHNTNMSNSQMNMNNLDHLNSSNSFQTNGNLNQMNCLNNQISSLCGQHQILTSSGNHAQSQNQHSSGSNQMHINNGTSINNNVQIMNSQNNHQIFTNSNMNNHNNMCNTNRPMNADTIDNHNFNRVINENHNSGLNDKVQMQVGNSNCVHQLSASNNMMNNQMQLNVNASNNQTVQESSARDIASNNINSHSQYQINGNQMFLISNPNNNISSGTNVLHGISNNYSQQMQSNNSSDIQNGSRQSSEMGNNMHDGNQLNMKITPKTNIFGSTIKTTIGNSNIDISMIPTELSDSSKLNTNKPTTPVLSISSGNQIGYIQMNANNQILGLNDQNRLPNNLSSQIQAIQRTQSTPILTIGQNDLASQNSASSIITTKGNDMPSLTISVNSNVISGSHMPSLNKQINLPQHNIVNNCMNPSVNFSISGSNLQPLQSLHNNSSNNVNTINLPAQNVSNPITLPIQNSSSISLPKAPPHQSGIPTNVVNPIPQYMRPMNRVLPIHRDAQSAKTPRIPKIKIEPPKASPHSHDMPDLNSKDDEITTNEVNKIINETKVKVESEQAHKKVVSAPTVNMAESSVQNNVTVTTVETVEPKTVEPVLKEKVVKNEIEDSRKLTKQKENISENIVKAQVQKLDIMKISKENSICNLKNHLSSQRKVHVRNKSGLENISSVKLAKLPSSSAKKLPKDDGPKLIYEINSEDGFSYSSASLSELWNKVLDAVQTSRKQHGLPLLKFSLSQNITSAHILGLHNNALKYLVEQLPGASRCMKYKMKHGNKMQSSWDADASNFESFRENPWGAARAGPAIRKSSADMFSWLASPYRDPPPSLNITQDDNMISRRLTSTTLPIAMRFRHLKETSKQTVGVYRSHIHGRGLFCRRDIEAGEMVIEYAGEVIRAALADQRERRYEAARGGRGVTGCYMFRVDDHLVVDATMKGNAARFINHSCDPNCYSKVVDILGHKHILILALRRIYQGEELTYDYKFPFEEVKIPCSCGAKKCRKYLN